MTKNEYLRKIDHCTIDQNKLSKIQQVYSDRLPELLKKMISNNNESIFFEDGMRMLSYAEILDAERDLCVEFQRKGLIPVADCGENDFIVYDFMNEIWAKFNIVDETLFKKCSEIDELLK